jgi:hypothetical protein
VILPGSLLLASAAAFSPIAYPTSGPLRWTNTRLFSAIRVVVGSVLIVVLGYHYFQETRPILRHVEYAGLIPRLEKLASTFAEDDLVIVESRPASDVHVLALPLAYIYAKHVLVLGSQAPDKRAFRAFLSWALAQYRRVFFVGGGGTELLSRTMKIAAVGGERFQIPEYQSDWNVYPRVVQFKEFDFGIYEFLPGEAEATGFDLDVGMADDLYVRRFNAKERRPSGLTFRWTRDTSFVSLTGARADCRRLAMAMASGSRPAAAPSASVALFLNDLPLGGVSVREGLETYRFEIPSDLMATIAAADVAAQLRVVSTTWNPSDFGGGDNRDLGVMVDRVTLECGP